MGVCKRLNLSIRRHAPGQKRPIHRIEAGGYLIARSGWLWKAEQMLYVSPALTLYVTYCQARSGVSGQRLVPDLGHFGP